MLMRLPFIRCLACALLFCATVVSMSPADGPTSPDQARKRLADLAKKANDVSEKEYTISTWNPMRIVLTSAQGVIKRQDASAGDLNQAFDQLNQAVTALQKRKVAPDDRPRLGLCGYLVATNATGTVNNAALMWGIAESFDRFDIQRATRQAGPFQTIHTGTGTSYNDYALAAGTYFYRVVARKGAETLTSNVVSLTPMSLPQGLIEYSNQRSSEEPLPGQPLQAGKTYYRFNVERDGKALGQVRMRTSSDGKAWSDGSSVMDRNSHPDLADFKFESEDVFYDKLHDQIVWWCHWELSQGYGSGKAMVATAKPGQPFKVHHIYNPLGIQVRDMSVFIDDDHTGYLVAASNLPGQGANATIYIFKLNETYDDAVEIVSKVAEGGYREAPHIVKEDGFYYVLFSQAAGWYPSQGGYVSARSLRGPWGEPRAVGNASTFSSQSGAVIDFGNADGHVPVMMGNRWVRSEGTSRNSVLPIHFAQGFAFYDYAPSLLCDASRGVLISMQQGRLLSQDRPAESSIPGNAGHDAAKAFDGSYDTSFQSDKKSWPFTLTTDLGSPSTVRNVQVSWFIQKGSEAYYTYAIEGSLDGKEWATLLDRSNASDATLNKTYGFTSDLLPENSVARYVRLKVLQAHLHNNPNNWYPPTVYEMKVFGDPGATK